MTAVLEGEVICRRHDDGRVEIVQAPPTARIALAVLVGADPVVVKADGNTVTFGGQVVYRIVGWDGHGSALLAELAEDRRAGR